MGKSVSRPHPELTDLTSLHCFSALLSNSEKRCETACWALVVVLDGKKASMTSVTGLLSTSVLRKACFVKPGVNTSPNFFVASPPNLIRLSVSIHSPISNSIFSSRLLSHSGEKLLLATMVGAMLLGQLTKKGQGQCNNHENAHQSPITRPVLSTHSSPPFISLEVVFPATKEISTHDFANSSCSSKLFQSNHPHILLESSTSRPQ